jgi:hypothetical protein
MSEPVITKTFSYNFFSIIFAKLRRFWKRNLWRYLIAAVMGTVGIQILNEQEIFAGTTFHIFLKITVAVLFFSLLAILTSSIFLSIRNRNKTTTISFYEDEIVILHTPGGVEQTKNWDWIRSADETKLHFILDTCVKPRRLFAKHLFIILPKSKLSDDERVLFSSWLVQKGKLNKRVFEA